MRESWEQQEPISPRGKWLTAACWSLALNIQHQKTKGIFILIPNTIGFLDTLRRNHRAFTNIFIFAFTAGALNKFVQTLSVYFFGFLFQRFQSTNFTNTKSKFAKTILRNLGFWCSCQLSIGECWWLVWWLWEQNANLFDNVNANFAKFNNFLHCLPIILMLARLSFTLFALKHDANKINALVRMELRHNSGKGCCFERR